MRPGRAALAAAMMLLAPAGAAAEPAAGSIRVEVLDPAGDPVPGSAMADAPALFGDELDAVYRWKDGRRLGELRGGPVMLRFVLTDADLFSIRTGG